MNTSLSYTIVIKEAPWQGQQSLQALKFCQALLEKGHHLARVFFYQDGVLNASALQWRPADENSIESQWREFALKHQLELALCITGSLRRGITDAKEAQRNALPSSNVQLPWALTGLGQLIEASVESDRTVSFG
ncbi:sulfurtransferase complex subunit TusD [Pelagibaculum spongiae]|uniref:Sulfurtransferase complex subunit TusD n=1 Tax=Pelagibaculum spongiae TaxID=2080658 RepID=A0A2V1GXG3_9GAMM|nr:sulfurtransferase complex subunit TusD [Pelagibaculum spongiae]PVZ71476.1 sulfurtransferase complex subunit TusD [Pelagibaculum spongiae]